jgi:uncharacterized Fe-S radical SAM superfamily protein PflX
MAVFWDLHHVIRQIMTNVSEELTASIISVMSQYLQDYMAQQRPEDSHLHT